MKKIRLKRIGSGVYATLDGRFEIQQPHGMEPADPEKSWFVIDRGNEVTLAEVGTLREAREIVAAKY